MCGKEESKQAERKKRKQINRKSQRDSADNPHERKREHTAVSIERRRCCDGKATELTDRLPTAPTDAGLDEAGASLPPPNRDDDGDDEGAEEDERLCAAGEETDEMIVRPA